MRLWWCIQRPTVLGEDEHRPGNSLAGRFPEESHVRSTHSIKATGLSTSGSCSGPSCELEGHPHAHQAPSLCLQQQQQWPLQCPQQILQQLPQSMQPEESRLLDDRYYIPFSELVFHQMIGQGSFKSVFRGRWRNTNVAIVRMRKGGLLTEARLMQQLSTHPNLVQFYRWSADTQGNEYILLELVPLGSLDRILLRFGEVLRIRMKLTIAEQVAAAMAELSSEGVLHRDLAARNVLVQSLDPVHVKVADFGLAHQFHCQPASNNGSFSSNSSGVLQLNSIPVRWCAPEVISHQEWGPGSDVWAFGVTLWEIFADGAEPYARQTDAEVADMVLSGGRLPRPARCPRDVYGLMMHCWATDPQERPTFTDILATFSQWRQEHAQQAQTVQQMHASELTSPRAICAQVSGSSPLRHAHSWAPQQAATAGTAFRRTGCDTFTHSRVTPGTSSQVSAGGLPRGGMLPGEGTGGVYRSLSEPLPGWDLNQQAKAVLQPGTASGQCQATSCSCSVRDVCGGSCCCRTASAADSCSSRDSGSCCRLVEAHVGPAEPPHQAASVCSSCRSIEGCGSPSALYRTDATVHAKVASCSPATSASGGAEQQGRLQMTHQPAQHMSYVPLSQQPSVDSCLSHTSCVWSSWCVDGWECAEGPAGVVHACDHAHPSVEMSFEIERMIDPNAHSLHQSEDFENVCGSWDPLATARTWSTCSSRCSSDISAATRRHYYVGHRTTALYGNARDMTDVQGLQSDSGHSAQTVAANSGRAGLADTAKLLVSGMPAASSRCGAPRSSAYVDVRSVVYGGTGTAR